MKERYYIVILIGFCFTLLFELAPEYVYRDWFFGTDVIYPDHKEEWGGRAGTHAVSLQHYLDDIAEHLHIIALYLYIFINTKEKPIFGILLILFCFSLLNYLFNYHQPLIFFMDMNYGIIGFMIFVALMKGRDSWR